MTATFATVGSRHEPLPCKTRGAGTHPAPDPTIAMDAARKKAYRHLLYRAMTGARSILSVPAGHPEERLRGDCAYVIADLMHNLAHFSAQEFEGFDEACFWRTAAGAASFDALLAHLANRDAFERSVTDVVPADPRSDRDVGSRPLLRLPDGWRSPRSPGDTVH